jgi:hypothetical protein
VYSDWTVTDPGERGLYGVHCGEDKGTSLLIYTNSNSRFNTVLPTISAVRRREHNKFGRSVRPPPNWTGSLGTQRIGCPKCGVASGYTVIAVTVVIGLNVMS